MPRNPSASSRLAEMMEDRRVELRLQWADVAKRGEVSYESIRQARNGKKMSGLIEAGIERGLAWERGSIRRIRAGGEPTNASDPDTTRRPASQDGYQSSADATAAVLNAIDNHPGMLPEAKEHLRNQVGLLLRLEASRAAAAADGFDEELERRIAGKARDIRAERALTAGQQEQLIDIMEAEERAKVATFDGRRNPHLDVRFEESDDDDLTEDEAAAALAEEESQSRECQPNGR